MLVMTNCQQNISFLF